MREAPNEFQTNVRDMSQFVWQLKVISRQLGLTTILKRILPAEWLQGDAAKLAREAEYANRLASEQSHFAACINVHDLPEIFHYWSNKYLRPKLEQCGFSNPDQFFVAYMEKTFADDPSAKRTFVSIGAGNCDTEVRLAVMLNERGYKNFVIDCVDINEVMLKRGQELAAECKVAANIRFQIGDFNLWTPMKKYDAVIANQSLHHVTNLEHLFDAIKDAIGEAGLFITSDMIGRNGHQRWPAALTIVNEFWKELAPEKKFNLQLQRNEPEFMDWDCSTSGFEGIRSQDIVPQLLTRFEFDFFYAFGNLVDPFIDRSFGHHFDPNDAKDRDLIDRIHARDEMEMAAGTITPTHMFAVLKNGPPGRCAFSLDRAPMSCVPMGV